MLLPKSWNTTVEGASMARAVLGVLGVGCWLAAMTASTMPPQPAHSDKPKLIFCLVWFVERMRLIAVPGRRLTRRVPRSIR